MGDLVWSIITSSPPSVTRFKREEFEQKAKALTLKHARKESEEKENKRTIEDERGGEKKLKI